MKTADSHNRTPVPPLAQFTTRRWLLALALCWLCLGLAQWVPAQIVVSWTDSMDDQAAIERCQAQDS